MQPLKVRWQEAVEAQAQIIRARRERRREVTQRHRQMAHRALPAA